MSILIKGMEMPKNCRQCFYKRSGCPRNKYNQGRPTDCPLVEVKPHGRLIDADELKGKDFRYEIHGIPTARVIFARAIENAPTIIDAEGEE